MKRTHLVFFILSKIENESKNISIALRRKERIRITEVFRFEYKKIEINLKSFRRNLMTVVKKIIIQRRTKVAVINLSNSLFLVDARL